MYNKYIFINNNRKKKQKELEINGEINDTQISFEMLSKIQNENNKEKSNQYNKNAIGKNLTKFIDDYVLVDIETTGFSPINDEIIEIGAIKVENNKIVKQYDELIKIDKILPQKITELTGITDNMLKNGKLPNIVLEEFIEFVGNNIIVGHNVNFDLGFLCNKCKKYLNYNLNNDYIDTLYLARKLVPNAINHKLGTLAKMFNISYEGTNRGLKDIKKNNSVYNSLRKIQ